jgi:hypothetical protein
MTTQGDEFLKQEIDAAITKTSMHVDPKVCDAHEVLGVILGAVNVLCRCKKSEMEGASPVSKTSVTLISSGVATGLLAMLELLKTLATK